ncbi:hypothetical protein IGI04_022053 [Brassica rapa subsp. trilocularis]|uniref:BIG2 domain-containing protein n=1 Tax=Brassica rapa subsp. trilocularis TaxID=1813537 RepID=A0ABQ7M1D5_BRACM|nr:hypothetical protein IGI04_022053 [Brassica rapa subsp. trilocularis]
MVRLGIFIFLLFLTLVGETSSSSDLPRVCECEQVQFTSNNIEDDTPQILLPWSPSCQEMQLIVTGGCAKASTDYKWLTSDTSIISVSPYGIMKAKRPGIATVKVVSTIEPQNFDEIFVKVLVPPPMVMWQNVLVQTVVASRLQIGVTMKYSKGAQNFNTTLHRNSTHTDSVKEALSSRRCSTYPLKFRKNKFVALDNGKKATFECYVKPPFIGTSKPWIELQTGNIYCIFFSNLNNMKPLKGASSALLLGRLSVSGTRKTMNITSEFNNVIITILENSDVQIHRRKKESLSMSSRVDVGPKTEVEMIVTLSAAGQKMIIRYEVDESQIPVNPYFVYLLMVPFLDFIVRLSNKPCPAKLESHKQSSDTTKSNHIKTDRFRSAKRDNMGTTRTLPAQTRSAVPFIPLCQMAFWAS